MAARRHVRPPRRRLPPLLGRRALARAALREDALRQRAARPRLPARLARDRQRALPRGRRARRSTTCCASCASPEGGFASSQDADTDGVEGLTYTWAPGEGAPEELLEPFEHGRFVLRGELDEETRARLLEIREQRPQPASRRQGDRLLERARARRARRGGPAARARRPVDAARGSASSCSARSPTSDGRLQRTAARPHDGRRLPRRLRQRRARALRAARRDRRAALAERGAPARAARGRALRATRSAAASSSRRPTASSSSRARRISTTTRSPSGNSMLAFVLLRLARIWGDDELERQAVGVLRLVRDASLARAPTAFGWALCALDLHLSPPAELAIVGPPDSEVARAALEPLRPERRRRLRPGRRRPAARGQGRSSTASPRSTSASASPAARRSPSRPSCTQSARPATASAVESSRRWRCSRSGT